MAFQIGSNFRLRAQLPLDEKSVVADIAARNALVNNNEAYNGLIVYVISDSTYYSYNGTTWSPLNGTNNIVLTSGDQNISGVKNFTSRPTVSGTGILFSGEAVRSNGTITRMINLTQAQYNALSPKDPTTFYVIVG
jgi:hypothetical protein